MPCVSAATVHAGRGGGSHVSEVPEHEVIVPLIGSLKVPGPSAGA